MSQGGLPIGLPIGGYHHGTTEKAGNRHRDRRLEVVALGVRRDARRRGDREQARRQHAQHTSRSTPHARTTQAKPKTHLTPKLKEGRTSASRYTPRFNPAESQTETPSALVPLEQVARMHLVSHVGQIIAPAVGHNHVALGLELGQIVSDLAAEELRRGRCGLVDHHGRALGLGALHDALDRARAEVVAVRLPGQTVRANDRLLLASADLVPRHLRHLIDDEVFAGAIGVNYGLDQILGHVLAVRQQLLGIFGQVVAAIAEARVVVAGANARLQAYTVDDVARKRTKQFAQS